MYEVSSTFSSLFLNLFSDTLSATELAYIHDQMLYYIRPTSNLNEIFETYLLSYSTDLINMNKA